VEFMSILSHLNPINGIGAFVALLFPMMCSVIVRSVPSETMENPVLNFREFSEIMMKSLNFP
jgi:hypothetical protein